MGMILISIFEMWNLEYLLVLLYEPNVFPASESVLDNDCRSNISFVFLKHLSKLNEISYI